MGVFPAQKLGIENLKKLIAFSCDFTKELSTALADGKFKWIEAFGFIGTLLDLGDVAKSWTDVKAELAELSAGEISDLNAYVSENFALAGDNAADVEAKVKNSLSFAVSAIALIDGWKKKGE